MAITWTVCPDAAMLQRAETDLRRALILQNSRVARRFDPAGKVRTHRNEERLRRIGSIASVVGLVLTTFLVIGYGARGEVRPLHGGLLVLFVLLVPVFVALPRIRQAGVRRVDAMLARRAKKVSTAWREGVERTYELDASVLRSRVDAEVVLARSMDGLRYGLLGDAVLMLFGRATQQTPKLVVLVGSEGERLARALEGVEVERLSRDLMPPMTVERSW